MRRALHRHGVLRSAELPVPVIVVGNISVGGTGKTPLVLWLAQFLREQGLRPGIISRGYGGTAIIPQEVMPDSEPRLCGDEPVLLARKSACPVWIGRDRVAVAQALLVAHPDVNVIISDDGLQHYRLRRDVEIAVIDGVRGLGNGFLLPAGPLREKASRLEQVDAVVVNGATATPLPATTAPRYHMHLNGEVFYNLLHSETRASATDLRGKTLHAVAGIGNPNRFFDHLRSLELKIVEHPFPDHHRYQPEDLAFSGAMVMTEKDAVKCAFSGMKEAWVLAVEAEVDPGLGQIILDKLKNNHGQ